MPAPSGNQLAVRHGAHSERQIGPRAAHHKRRLLRQIGLRASDLDGIGRGLLTNWARAAAALALMDAYAAQHGWLDDGGNPRGFTRLYVGLLNAERLALARLEQHVRARDRDAGAALRDYVDATYRATNGGAD